MKLRVVKLIIVPVLVLLVCLFVYQVGRGPVEKLHISDNKTPHVANGESNSVRSKDTNDARLQRLKAERKSITEAAALRAAKAERRINGGLSPVADSSVEKVNSDGNARLGTASFPGQRSINRLSSKPTGPSQDRIGSADYNKQLAAVDQVMKVYYDKLGLSPAERVQASELFLKRKQSLSSSLSSYDGTAGTVPDVARAHSEDVQEIKAQLIEAVGQEKATQLMELRASVPYRNVIVKDFADKCAVQGMAVSFDTETALAVFLSKNDIYIQLRPRAISQEAISQYTLSDEKALGNLGFLLTEAQIQILRQSMKERYVSR